MPCNCSPFSFLMILYTEKKKLVVKATKMCTCTCNFSAPIWTAVKIENFVSDELIVWLEPVRLADMFRMRSADSSAQEDGGNVRASHYTKLWKIHLQLQGGLITASKLATFDLHSVCCCEGMNVWCGA